MTDCPLYGVRYDDVLLYTEDKIRIHPLLARELSYPEIGNVCPTTGDSFNNEDG